MLSPYIFLFYIIKIDKQSLIDYTKIINCNYISTTGSKFPQLNCFNYTQMEIHFAIILKRSIVLPLG